MCCSDGLRPVCPDAPHSALGAGADNLIFTSVSEARRLMGRLANDDGVGSSPIRLFLGFDEPNDPA